MSSTDQELIALGLKFRESAERFDLVRSSKIENVDLAVALSVIDEAADQMIACRSESIAGLLIKAKIALWAHGEPSDATNEPTLELKMLWSIVEDVMHLASSCRG
jgi:hypothetical protein